MRSFSEFEKKVLRYLVENNDPTGVLAIVVIEKFANAIYIDWNEIDHIKIVTLRQDSIEQIRQNLFDIISLFKYLSNNDYIYCFPAKINMEKSIYNHLKYTIEEREDGLFEVWTKGKDILLKGKEYRMTAPLRITISDEKSGIGDELETWSNSSYHVTQSLRDFVGNNFKSLEQLQYEKNRNLTWISIAVSILIGLSSLIIGCIGIYIK
jgi:hypothetical protein